MVAFVSGLLLAGIVAAVAARPERWWSPGEGRVFPATLDYDVVIPNLPWRTSKPSGAAVRGTVGSSLFPSECRASLRVRHTSSRLNASRQSTRSSARSRSNAVRRSYRSSREWAAGTAGSAGSSALRRSWGRTPFRHLVHRYQRRALAHALHFTFSTPSDRLSVIHNLLHPLSGEGRKYSHLSFPAW